MKDCMLDLETLGRSSDAVIIQIGLCAFDFRTEESDAGVELNIDIQRSLEAGFWVDGGTVEWWMNQPEVAIKSILAQPRYSPQKACHFRQVGLQFPVHYRGFRDIRTLVALAGFTKSDWKGFYDNQHVKHTALGDCKTQIAYCLEAYARIQR
jgi:hypothetical protein